MKRCRFHLPHSLHDEILLSASSAFPLECCGLIEGVHANGTWHAHAVHSTKNLAKDPANHFLIDPQAHFNLLRRLRGTDRRIIGCFHSHPNGRAAPSADDRDQAIETDFVWLIAARDDAGSFSLNAYIFADTAGEFLPLDLYR